MNIGSTNVKNMKIEKMLYQASFITDVLCWVNIVSMLQITLFDLKQGNNKQQQRKSERVEDLE